jgi:hypothetical protein
MRWTVVVAAGLAGLLAAPAAADEAGRDGGPDCADPALRETAACAGLAEAPLPRGRGGLIPRADAGGAEGSLTLGAILGLFESGREVVATTATTSTTD